MRLLNVHSLEFRHFVPADAPAYAIASHRWGQHETTHLSFQAGDFFKGDPGRRKVKNFCRLVQGMNEKVIQSRAWTALGFELSCDWLWIDTACIDKTDSVELSEAINSMFSWYRSAAVCYAYLQDVRSMRGYQGAMLDFMQSEWFTRGWTLQELLAPGIVVFITKDWEVLGHKCCYDKPLCDVVCRGFGQRLDFILARITKIPLDVIRNFFNAKDLDNKEKISWLRGRITTRPEDRAYCLLGICDVFMSPIYGEGDEAWRRLKRLIQERAQQVQEAKSYDHNVQASPENFTSPCLAKFAKFGTQGEARIRKDIRWTITTQALHAPRARTDAAKRRLCSPHIPQVAALSAAPTSMAPTSMAPTNMAPTRMASTSVAPNIAPSNGPIPFFPTPLQLGHWLWLSHTVESVSIVGRETCGYCYGIIYDGHATVGCENDQCETLFHRRCAVPRCERCSPPPESHCGALSKPEDLMHPGYLSPVESCSPPATLPLPLQLDLDVHRHDQPLEVVSEDIEPSAQDSLPSADQVSIEQLSEIVSRRLALDMKHWSKADFKETDVNEASSDHASGEEERALGKTTDHVIQRAASTHPGTLKGDKKRRFTLRYWRDKDFVRLGHRKTGF